MSTVRDFIGRHGDRILYVVDEPSSAPKGVAVIAHGLGEHGARYDHVVDRLVAAGYRVAVPDHRGHGRSGGRRLALGRFGDYAADLAVVIEQVRDPALPTVLIGHSMGGAIALDFALTHPTRLDALVLSGPAILTESDPPGPLVPVARLLGRVAPRLPVAALDPNQVSRDPAVVAAYKSDPLVIRGRVPARVGAELVATAHGFAKRLGALRTPLLVMHGSGDKLTLPQGSRLVDRLAGSTDKTLVIWDGLLHEIFQEPEREQVLDTMMDWLAVRIP